MNAADRSRAGEPVGGWWLLVLVGVLSIAAGVNLFELARMMVTRLEQISRTYGHLLPDVLQDADGA